jgi:glycosyltransferase involved in cell wall biosynthesis
MELSIIIPVYNVEAYIEKCVRSLQDQDIPKETYEIIIINDGSPDNSRQVVLKLMEQFSNIVFIDQENKGVSMARNAGMDRASGKYLLFIDPDDYVEPNSFSRVLKAADDQEAQVAFLGFTFLNADGTVRKQMFFSEFKNQAYTGIEGYYNSRKKITIDPDRAWAILFERAFVNSAAIRYIPGIPYLEDGEFLARILCLVEKSIFEGNSFYMRTTRPGSATNSSLFYAEKSIDGFIKAASNLKVFSQNPALSEEQRVFMNQPLSKFILLAVESSAKISRVKKLLFLKKKLNKNGLQKISLEGVLWPYSTYARIYNISPFLFIIYLNWKKILLSMKLKFQKCISNREELATA